MLIDHRGGKFFGGIMLQEYSPEKGSLIGEAKLIFEGSELGITEGPHLYQRDGYYYLLTAEGGTEYGHAVSIARSKSIEGPYQIHPDNPIITAAHEPSHAIQKAGHADLVETSDGKVYAVYLGARPLTERGRCILGRESCISEITWNKNQWPIQKGGSKLPPVDIDFFHKNEEKKVWELLCFENDVLSEHYQTLRIPTEESWIKYEGKFLKLKGRESLASTFEQSLVARRVQSFQFEYTTKLQFAPRSFQHMAGLVMYYNTGHHYYLFVTYDESKRKNCIQLIVTDNFETKELLDAPVELENEEVMFKVVMTFSKLQFYFSTDEFNWKKIGQACDASILSDDYVREGGQRYRPAFTGCFVGVACQNLRGGNIWANFSMVEYKET